MKKLTFILLLSVIFNFVFADDESAFEDLFQDIDIEEQQQDQSEFDQDVIDSDEDSSDDVHHAADDLPNPNIHKKEDWWEKYIWVDWDIDYNEYSPLIMVNRDWSTYRSKPLWEDVHLDAPWEYLVRAQARIDWEYVVVYETSIINEGIDSRSMWEPESWPALYFILITTMLALIIYVRYFYRLW